MGYKNHGTAKESGIHANYGGNSAKSMRSSLEDSLKKLQTDYIDLFYLHYVSNPATCLKRPPAD